LSDFRLGCGRTMTGFPGEPKPLSSHKMRWYNSIYAEIRELRDDPANTPELKEKFTNLLAAMILLRTE